MFDGRVSTTESRAKAGAATAAGITAEAAVLMSKAVGEEIWDKMLQKRVSTRWEQKCKRTVSNKRLHGGKGGNWLEWIRQPSKYRSRLNLQGPKQEYLL